MVEGEFVRVGDVGRAMETLDGIEGFRGYGEDGSLYRRTFVNVDVGEGRTRHAWTYLCGNESSGVREIASGDWRAHRQRRSGFLRSLVAAHVGRREDRVAAAIAGRIPFAFNPDRDATVRRLLPLASALENGRISERLLAQHSGQWTVIPDA